MLRELIQLRTKSHLKLHNLRGNAIPDEQIKNEYQKIRQYLLDFYTDPISPIALALTKDYRYLLTMMACMEIGIPYVPLKADYPSDRIAQIREDSHFTLLLSDSKMEEILHYPDQKKTSLPEIFDTDEAYTIFTSGTTGRSKGVVIQRHALLNFFQFTRDYFSHVTHEERLLQCTEFNFDLSVQDIALFLTRNVAVYFSDFGQNIFKLAHEIDTYRISIINTVPNNLNMFLTDMVADRMDYSCLKYLNIGGARFSHGLYKKCLKYFSSNVQICNFYGPTEVTVYCHVRKLSFIESEDSFETHLTIGTPLPHLKAIILQGEKILGANERGELCVGGIQVMKGYSNNPSQTEKVFVIIDGVKYYRTGDLAYMNERGSFFIVGRADDTIKHRGYRIDLLDIDSYITRLPYVQDSTTIAIPNENTENQTIGFIILKEKKAVKEIKSDLSAFLLDYQIPEKIFFVDHFPTNSSGKVCRNSLTSHYLETQTKV